jgi:hypothetical protein
MRFSTANADADPYGRSVTENRRVSASSGQQFGGRRSSSGQQFGDNQYPSPSGLRSPGAPPFQTSENSRAESSRNGGSNNSSHNQYHSPPLPPLGSGSRNPSPRERVNVLLAGSSSSSSGNHNANHNAGQNNQNNSGSHRRSSYGRQSITGYFDSTPEDSPRGVKSLNLAGLRGNNNGLRGGNNNSSGNNHSAGKQNRRSSTGNSGNRRSSGHKRMKSLQLSGSGQGKARVIQIFPFKSEMVIMMVRSETHVEILAQIVCATRWISVLQF